MSRVRMFVAGVVVLGIMGVAALGAHSAPVPFKGRGTGAIVGQDVLGPTEVLVTTTGTGNATHLGEFTRTEELNLNPQTGSFTGTVTFTAANGHQVACTMTGQFVSATEATGEYVVIGGTGRFAGASGSATFDVSMTGATSFRFNFLGDISF